MWTDERVTATIYRCTIIKAHYEISLYYDRTEPNLYAVGVYNTKCNKTLFTAGLDNDTAFNALRCLDVTENELKQLIHAMW